MSNLTKPQRKQLERQISEAQEKLRRDDLQKCLEMRMKALYKAILTAGAHFEDSMCNDLMDDKYSNSAIEKAFFIQ